MNSNNIQSIKPVTPDVSLDQVPVALLAVHTDGGIRLLNRAACHLFNKEQVDDESTIGQSVKKDMLNIQPGQKVLSSIIHDDITMPVTLVASEAQYSETSKIVSVQPIKQELDFHEVNAWKNIVSLLCHKMGNIIVSLDALSGVFNHEPKSSHSLLFEDNTEHLEKTIFNSAQKLKRYFGALNDADSSPTPRLQRISLNWLLSTLSDICGEWLNDSKITLVINLPDNDREILGDLVLLQDALIQLVSNARDALANTANGKIELSILHKENDQTIINIVDNGPGIPQNLMDTLFLPLFTTKTETNGIGLAIVRQIIHLHNGSISAANNQAEGALFRIELDCSIRDQHNM